MNDKVVGPKKIVLINSGKYDYAEIDIDEAVHLVGANNSGKTTIIALLQLLYIDNKNLMVFSHEKKDTWKYYFKGDQSYVLFECLTPNGWKTVGARGLKGMSGDFERFVCDLSYDSKDYLYDDGNIKPGEEVRRNLSVHNYKTLKSSDIQAVLTGVGLNDSVYLGLLPVKNKSDYIKFRGIYKNLLNLSHVKQAEFQEALLHMCLPQTNSKGCVDVGNQSSDFYNQIKVKQDAIKMLKLVKTDIEEALEKYDTRASYRGDLVAGFKKIDEEFRALKSRNEDEKNVIKMKLQEVESKITQATQDGEVLDDKIKLANQEIGALGTKISDLNKAHEKYGDFPLQMKQTELEGYEADIKKRQFQLESVKDENVDVIAKEIKSLGREIKAKEHSIATHENSVATYLSKFFSKEQAAKFFSLYNNRLLSFDVTDPKCVIKNQDALLATIEATLAKISKENVYEDENISLYIGELLPDLKEYLDVEVIKEALVLAQNRLKKEKDKLETAEDIVAKKKILKEKEDFCAILKEEIRACVEYRNSYKDYAALKKMFEEKEGENEQFVDKRNKELSIIEELKIKRASQNTVRKKTIDAENTLHKKILDLIPPQAGWEASTDYDFDDLEFLIQNHQTLSEAEKQVDKDFDRRMKNISNHTYDRIKGESEEETLQLLRAELNSLAEQEDTIEALYRARLTGLVAEIRDVVQDIGVIEDYVLFLNKRLAKIKISDLVSAKIVVLPKHKIVHALSKFIKHNDSQVGLFKYTEGESEDVFASLKKLIGTQDKILLADLFSLRIDIVKIDGTKEEYDGIEAIESNGTTITLKVILNLLLLKGLFNPKTKVTIPFFLDEIANLDRQNASSIVKHGEDLGFTPIVASPDQMGITRNIYPLRSGQKSLSVSKQDKQVISRVVV